MPYIPIDRRVAISEARLADMLNPLAEAPVKSAGELNYVLTRISLGYYARHGARYQVFNDISGAFSLAAAAILNRDPWPNRPVLINEIRLDGLGYACDRAADLAWALRAVCGSLLHFRPDATIECLGALEEARAEFRRRIVVPYERAKATSVGDVYPEGALK